MFPIPGTKRVKYLEQNAAAFQIKLTAEEKQQLEAVFASDQVQTFMRCVRLLAVLHQHLIARDLKIHVATPIRCIADCLVRITCCVNGM